MEKRKFQKPRVFALATVLIFSAVSMLGHATVKNEVSQERLEDVGRCGVMPSQIISYLEGLGYSNIILSSYSGCDVIADTDYSYDTIVYCDSEAIIGHEDLPE